MRIFFYNHTGTIGGAEKVLLMILAQLDKNRFDIVAACPARGSLTEEVRSLGVPCRSVSCLEARLSARPQRLLRAARSLRRVVLELREQITRAEPDIIHANGIRAGIVATLASANLKIPIVWHIHDLLPSHPLSSLIRFCAACSPRVRLLAVSRAGAENFRGKFLSRKIAHRPVRVIRNAIDLGKFRPQAESAQAVRDELDLHSASLLIGIVGYLAPCKGQLELIRAFARVREEFPGAVLLVVGAPLFDGGEAYLRRLIEAADELEISGSVRFLNQRDDIERIMCALDLLVVNSTSEGFSLVVAEAMASGACVLATAVGGIPELIEHDINGWLIQPRDEAELSAALLTLCRQSETRARLADRARREVAERFSVSRYMKKLEEFYESSRCWSSHIRRDGALCWRPADRVEE